MVPWGGVLSLFPTLGSLSVLNFIEDLLLNVGNAAVLLCNVPLPQVN